MDAQTLATRALDEIAAGADAETIFEYPHPLLRKVSTPVADFDETLAQLAHRLFLSMYAGPGGVGIAAVQIGELSRVVTMDCMKRQKKSHGPLVLVNPEIVATDGEKLVREGCLSLPNYLGRVMRARRVTVQAADLSGEIRRYEFKQLEAICAQHEIDHLDGVLFIDRVRSLHEDVDPRAAGRGWKVGG